MRTFNKNPSLNFPRNKSNIPSNARKDKKSYHFIPMLRVQGIIFARPPFCLPLDGLQGGSKGCKRLFFPHLRLLSPVTPRGAHLKMPLCGQNLYFYLTALLQPVCFCHPTAVAVPHAALNR